MVGLRTDSIIFLLKFLMILTMFNLTAASLTLTISLFYKNPSVANVVAVLCLLFQMLFGGLLLNKNSIPQYFKFLSNFSFFSCALEAMIVNEVNGLFLKENKYGLVIDVI